MSLSVFRFIPQEYRIVERPYWLLGVLTWMAIRFESRDTMLAVAITSIVSIYSVVADSGAASWGAVTHLQQVLNIQGFLIVVIIATLSVSISFTERKRAEEKLRQGEERYRSLFENNPIQTIIVDNQGRVTGYNMSKRLSGDRLPNIGNVLYKDYAGKHAINMHEELARCIKTGESKVFPELKYRDKSLLSQR